MSMKTISLLTFLLCFTLNSYSQESIYLKMQADEYFKVGRYNDAFFVYLDLARGTQNTEFKQAVKNASHAMYLTKKFKDYRFIKQYDLAKSHLRSLIELNPTDPHRGQLPDISIEQASNYHRFALRQLTIQATIDFFDRAIVLYQEAINDGSTDDSLETAIALCHWAKSETHKGERTTHEVLIINDL